MAQDGKFDYVETTKGRYILIKKNIGPGWIKVAEVRSEYYARELMEKLNG